MSSVIRKESQNLERGICCESGLIASLKMNLVLEEPREKNTWIEQCLWLDLCLESESIRVKSLHNCSLFEVVRGAQAAHRMLHRVRKGDSRVDNWVRTSPMWRSCRSLVTLANVPSRKWKLKVYTSREPETLKRWSAYFCLESKLWLGYK